VQLVNELLTIREGNSVVQFSEGTFLTKMKLMLLQV